ncbi:hypothetical protein GARCT_00572 [Geobacillus sp. 12AMOR1]|nr:hypothetical protein GARCT_00572 [Geobacillus sp. 12AMOR1]
MYLTFKDKHDSNVAQRDVWYKKEKCCFDFLYHNRLSLSSTLCGEEPKIEKFLHAYNFEHDYSVIQERLHALLRYIDHALEVSEQKTGVEQYAYFYS